MLLQTRRYINYAFSGFFALLVVCITIAPQGWTADDGISFYGGHLQTIVPYILAFGVCAFFLLKAADVLQNVPNMRWVAWLFRVFCLLFLVLVITPYTNDHLGAIHDGAGATLFILELIIAVWLVATSFDWPAAGLLTAQILGGVAALYYLPTKEGYLIQGQMIFQIAFWLLIARQFNRLAGSTKPPSGEPAALR